MANVHDRAMAVRSKRPRIEPPHAVQRFPLSPEQLMDRRTRTEHTPVLCHLGVPCIEPASWSLDIDGLIARPRALSFAALLRYPKVEVASVHQCCGSPFAPFEPTRRVCNVVWGGVRLADVLHDAGLAERARYLWCQGADGGQFGGVSVDGYCKDLPFDRIGTDVLLAYEMNGAPLSPEHGAPVRLVVPGFYGTNSVKWLTRITVADQRAREPFTTRWYSDPVLDGLGEETGATTPVWALAPESVIVSPAPRDMVQLDSELEVWGWAWADGGVSEVWVRTSETPSWQSAHVEPARGHEWQRFSFAWTPRHRGPALLASRAATERGERQPLAGRRNSVYGVPMLVV
jgi:DMSO/TMAO reductase YedYZ molybdopterin-dependent catalytic subunit